jgi:two-component system response regulator TtrR
VPFAVRSDARDRRRRVTADDHLPTAHIICGDRSSRIGLARAAGDHTFTIKDYATVGSFIAAYDGSRPGVIVVYLPMPNMSGMDALHNFAQHGVVLPVMMVSEHADVSTAVQCMKLGASDFVEAPIDPADLHQRIADMLADDEERARADAEMSAISRRFETLSQREQEILEMILRGAGSKEIARLLDISSKTVDVHRTNLMRKVGVSSVTQLVYLGLSVRHRRS